MKTSENGIKLIKFFEGFSSKPYRCPAGVWTNGYGNTFGVNKDTAPITEAQGEVQLAANLRSFENSVNRLIKVELTQGQFDALVSFCYNLGSGALQGSTLRQRLNRGDYDGAGKEFPRWCKANGIVLEGLKKRRLAERNLFIGNGLRLNK